MTFLIDNSTITALTAAGVSMDDAMARPVFSKPPTRYIGAPGQAPLTAIQGPKTFEAYEVFGTLRAVAASGDAARQLLFEALRTLNELASDGDHSVTIGSETFDVCDLVELRYQNASTRFQASGANSEARTRITMVWRRLTDTIS